MQRLLISTFFTVVSFLGCYAQWNTSSMLRIGQNAIYFDDYVSAIDNFNHIIRVKPYLSEPYFFRGLAKLNLDDYDGAIQDFSQALELNPNYFHAYTYRGVALNRMNRFEDALKDYDKAISLDPTSAYVYANRGMTEADLGNYIIAEKNFSKALQIDNELLLAYLNRAIVRDKLGNIDASLADCNAAIRLNVFSDEAFGLRGYLYYQQKKYYDAIDDFNRALKANPENKQVLMSRAIAWYGMKKYPEALADYSEAIKRDSNNIYAYYNRALLRGEVGETNAAIQDLDQVVEMNADNILIYFNRGLLKMEIKDWYGAFDDFSESIRLYPDFVKAYIARASVRVELNDMEDAEKDRYMAMQIMDRYKKMKSGDKNALVDTTANFKKLIDLNVREDNVRDVINGRVQDKKVMIELQDVFYVQYMSLDSLRTGKVQYYNKQIMGYNQAHNYEPALTLCNKDQVYGIEMLNSYIEKLSANISQNADLNSYLLRGGFYMNQAEYPKAIDDFTMIINKENHNLLALFNRANARVMMYDYIESIEDKTAKVIGDIEDKNGKVDYSLVLADYNKCLEIDPEFVFALFNIANVYAKSGEISKAIETYTQVIRKDKDIAEAYFNRGLLYIYTGQKALANADLSKAGELGIVGAYNIIKRYCK